MNRALLSEPLFRDGWKVDLIRRIEILSTAFLLLRSKDERFLWRFSLSFDHNFAGSRYAEKSL